MMGVCAVVNSQAKTVGKTVRWSRYRIENFPLTNEAGVEARSMHSLGIITIKPLPVKPPDQQLQLSSPDRHRHAFSLPACSYIGLFSPSFFHVLCLHATLWVMTDLSTWTWPPTPFKHNWDFRKKNSSLYLI